MTIEEMVREYACPDCGARPSIVARGRNVTEVVIAHEATCPWYAAAQKRAAS